MNKTKSNYPEQPPVDKTEKAIMAGSCLVVGAMALGWLALGLLVVVALIKFVAGG